MSSHTVSKLLVAAIIFTAVTGGAVAGDTMRLQQVREGRFVYFADLDTISREGSGARLRSLQMSDEPMLIDGKAYIGGYSNWQFDCEARTGRREDYASLRDDGTVGPVTPIRSQPIDLAPGGEAAELAAVACGEVPQSLDATSIEEALALTRAF
ncbi:surface-adhesin E family protein [Brevundimonas sp.]|uniref:surface-adhesin E family protein n=1 Tax=Brevundimonas sp. TaxID=1871086 RepID=UPI0028A0CFCD|nr:surface-adhesin E family protein [Brevundimonas sp.]